MSLNRVCMVCEDVYDVTTVHVCPPMKDWPESQILAAIHDEQQAQTGLLTDLRGAIDDLAEVLRPRKSVYAYVHPADPKVGDEVEVFGPFSPGGPSGHVAGPTEVHEAGGCDGCTTGPESVTVTRSRATALAAAAALEAAIHMVDDDEAAQTLARMADQWRAEAEEYPGPESVTVSLLDPPGMPETWRDYADHADEKGCLREVGDMLRNVADALDAASVTQEANQGERVAQGAGDAERPVGGRVARSTHSWTPKGLREHLCQQQTFSPDERTRWTIQILIDLLDVHRPIGNDGKHGERHTDTCGCEDR